jgi:hypothetical protein
VRAFFVPLDDPVLEELTKAARQDRRRPQDEAAVLIEQALALRGRRDPPGRGAVAPPVPAETDAAAQVDAL